MQLADALDGGGGNEQRRTIELALDEVYPRLARVRQSRFPTALEEDFEALLLEAQQIARTDGG